METSTTLPPEFPEGPTWLSLDTANLTESYGRVPGRISDQARRVAEARFQHQIAKAEKTHRLAVLATQVRAILKAEGDTKPSDARVEAAMYERHFPDVCEAIRVEAAADAYATACEGDLKALFAERDMLVQAGSDRREELRSLDPRVNQISSLERRANLAAEIARTNPKPTSPSEEDNYLGP